MAATSVIDIAGRPIGPGNPCLIIAEIAQAHDGSLGAAHSYIEAVSRTGVDAIKFQTHIAQAESTLAEPFRVGGFPQDASRFEYWQRMEFSYEQWAGLARHANECGLIFLSTPFSMQAVELLEKFKIPAWKIGSGDISTLPLLERVARTGKPVLLSSGMSSWSELDDAVECVTAQGAPVAIFQCTSAYPCPPEKIGLNVLAELRQRYACPVGLSDHSGAIFASLSAVSVGASLIEVHAVFSRDCFGPDVESSVTISELTELVAGIRFIERALAFPVNKNAEASERADLRIQFGRSLVAARDLLSGHRLTIGDIAFKKPATGISTTRLNEIIGRKINRAYARDENFKEDEFE